MSATYSTYGMSSVKTFDIKLIVIVGLIIGITLLLLTNPDFSSLAEGVTEGFVDLVMKVTGLDKATESIEDAFGKVGKL